MFTQDALINEMPKLRRFALRLARNTADADDLLQATLLRAMEHKHLFETGTNLFRWCSKIMFNLFVSAYRRRTKFESQYDPDIYLDKKSVAPAQETSAEIAEVGQAMELLSADHRELLIMVCAHGMQYDEVAELLEIPVGTVRSRLSRAREQLQGVLKMPATAYREMPEIPGNIASRAMQRKAA